MHTKFNFNLKLSFKSLSLLLNYEQLYVWVPDRCSFLSSFLVPCEPSGLVVDVDCQTNSAILSWNESEGAVEYFGFAQPMDGDMLYCDSTSTSCIIEGLECGEMYNFSVEASNGICNSSFSAPLQDGAGKCQSSKLNCSSSKNRRI